MNGRQGEAARWWIVGRLGVAADGEDPDRGSVISASLSLPANGDGIDSCRQGCRKTPIRRVSRRRVGRNSRNMN